MNEEKVKECKIEYGGGKLGVGGEGRGERGDLMDCGELKGAYYRTRANLFTSQNASSSFLKIKIKIIIKFHRLFFLQLA